MRWNWAQRDSVWFVNVVSLLDCLNLRLYIYISGLVLNINGDRNTELWDCLKSRGLDGGHPALYG
jgi:hypothetical protein